MSIGVVLNGVTLLSTILPMYSGTTSMNITAGFIVPNLFVVPDSQSNEHWSDMLLSSIKHVKPVSAFSLSASTHARASLDKSLFKSIFVESTRSEGHLSFMEHYFERVWLDTWHRLQAMGLDDPLSLAQLDQAEEITKSPWWLLSAAMRTKWSAEKNLHRSISAENIILTARQPKFMA